MYFLLRWVFFFFRGVLGLDRIKGDRLVWLGVGVGFRVRRGYGYYWFRVSFDIVLAEDLGL